MTRHRVKNFFPKVTSNLLVRDSKKLLPLRLIRKCIIRVAFIGLVHGSVKSAITREKNFENARAAYYRCCRTSMDPTIDRLYIHATVTAMDPRINRLYVHAILCTIAVFLLFFFSSQLIVQNFPLRATRGAAKTRYC